MDLRDPGSQLLPLCQTGNLQAQAVKSHNFLEILEATRKAAPALARGFRGTCPQIKTQTQHHVSPVTLPELPSFPGSWSSGPQLRHQQKVLESSGSNVTQVVTQVLGVGDTEIFLAVLSLSKPVWCPCLGALGINDSECRGSGTGGQGRSCNQGRDGELRVDWVKVRAHTGSLLAQI